MTADDWSRKERLCSDLLKVYDITEGKLAYVKGGIFALNSIQIEDQKRFH